MMKSENIKSDENKTQNSEHRTQNNTDSNIEIQTIKDNKSQTIPNPLPIPENDIPKYDLTKQILSKHRQNTSVKRIAPSRNIKISKNRNTISSQTTKSESIPKNNSSENIIAEIVAKDIKNLRSQSITK